MALYAIGDLHLSLGVSKPMDVFGGVWEGYLEKLNRGVSCIGPEDTTVLLGDLTWGMDLTQARPDCPDSREKDYLKGKSRLLVDHCCEVLPVL